MHTEVDFLIFQHVFGNEKGFIDYLKQQKEELNLNLSIVKRYSTDIKDAFILVEKLKNNFEFFSLDYEDNVWTCEFGNQYAGMYEVTAETVPLAICKAALKTYGINL
jgi:hypothetical protein